MAKGFAKLQKQVLKRRICPSYYRPDSVVAPLDKIEEALQELKKGYPLYGKPIVGGDLLQGEYQALIHPLPKLSEDEDFVTEHHTQVWKEMRQGADGCAATSH